MTVVVRTNPSSSITVNQGSQNSGSIVVKKGGSLTVESLQNVVSTDLQDGYTLVYDADTDKWITQTIDVAGIAGFDGGTY